MLKRRGGRLVDLGRPGEHTMFNALVVLRVAYSMGTKYSICTLPSITRRTGSAHILQRGNEVFNAAYIAALENSQQSTPLDCNPYIPTPAAALCALPLADAVPLSTL